MIYVCSDIHGHYDLFIKMLKTIQFSNKDELYILGDIIDRGPDGVKLLLNISKQKNMTLLLGNHELMMWDYFRLSPEHRVWSFKDRKQNWLNFSNGGRTTFEQFAQLSTCMQDHLLDYIEGLLLQKEIAMDNNGDNNTILLSHSDFIFDKGTAYWSEVTKDEVHDLVWNSPWRFWEYQDKEKYKKDGRLHIIGHVPTLNALYDDGLLKDLDSDAVYEAYIDKENNIINIDCGCACIEEGRDSSEFALCCMNLSKYCAGEKDAFLYIRKE